MEVLQPGQKNENGYTVKDVVVVEEPMSIMNVQVKDTRGKHIELKASVQYSGRAFAELGDMQGNKVYAKLVLYTYEESDSDERDQNGFDFAEEDTE